MIKKFSILILLSSLTLWSSLSQAGNRSGVTAAQFLKIGVSPRASAMGETVVAMILGAESMSFNPAGITFIDHVNIYFSHTPWFADINYNFFGAAMNVGHYGVIGINARVLYTDDMDVTTASRPYGTGEKFRASDYAIGLSYGLQVTDKFSIGATGKWIGSYVMGIMDQDYQISTFSVDVGTVYYTGYKSLRLGMCMSNLGGDVKFIKENYSLPTTLIFGIAMEAIENPDHTLTMAFQALRPNDANERFSLGFEYWFLNMFAFRAGYKLTYGNEEIDGYTENWSLGFGAKLNISGWQLQADYAYQNFRLFPMGINRFSIGIGW